LRLSHFPVCAPSQLTLTLSSWHPRPCSTSPCSGYISQIRRPCAFVTILNAGFSSLLFRSGPRWTFFFLFPCSSVTVVLLTSRLSPASVTVPEFRVPRLTFRLVLFFSCRFFRLASSEPIVPRGPLPPAPFFHH